VAAAAVGWARVRGRRHFPTDVVAGALLGAAVGAAVHAAAPGGDDRPTRLAAG